VSAEADAASLVGGPQLAAGQVQGRRKREQGGLVQNYSSIRLRILVVPLLLWSIQWHWWRKANPEFKVSEAPLGLS